MDVISLTKKLMSFNTINPPGDEMELAKFVGEMLSEYGFKVIYPVFGDRRLSLIAEKGLTSKKPPIVLSGHFDTVPLGNKEWRMDPFAGEVTDGKIWGRGSSDMKGGLAAMIIASIDSFSNIAPDGGVRLIFTAAEELGCQGITKLSLEKGIPGDASAIIIGEPTGNLPATGHKGAIYMNAVSKGKTAHSSMPEMGINAIYKATGSIRKIMDFDFGAEKDDLLGFPTINVGMIRGGMNLNSVPDLAEFTIDMRTTTKVDHNKIIQKLGQEVANGSVIEKVVDLNPVYTSDKDPFVQVVYAVCGIDKNSSPMTLPYMTDGAVLQSHYKAPTVILGSGEPGQAHQTNEFCFVDKLVLSVGLYKNIILKWSLNNE